MKYEDDEKMESKEHELKEKIAKRKIKKMSIDQQKAAGKATHIPPKGGHMMASKENPSAKGYR